MNLLKLLASDGFLVVNKTLMFKLGIYEAIILAELISEYNYWEAKGQLEDGYFYSTFENIEKNTNISLHHQRAAFAHLESLEILSKIRKGIPSKRYIKINEEKVIECLFPENINNDFYSTSNMCSSSNHTCSLVNMYDYGNNNNINNNNKKNNKNKNTSHFVETSDTSTQSLTNTSTEVLEENIKNYNNVGSTVGSNDISTENSNDKNINKLDITKNDDESNSFIRPDPKQVSKILTQKLSQVDKTETKINKLNKEKKEAEKLSVKEQVDKRNKKNRMKEAKRLIEDKDVLSSLDEFLDFYQFTFNLMSPQTWNKILTELLSFSNDTNILVKSINNSICNSWRSFYNPLTKRTRDNQPSYMIQKTNFYPADKIHETIDRALDDNGNIITF